MYNFRLSSSPQRHFCSEIKRIFQSFADSSKFSARQFDPAIDVNEKIMFLIVEVLFGRFPPRKIRKTSNRRLQDPLQNCPPTKMCPTNNFHGGKLGTNIF